MSFEDNPGLSLLLMRRDSQKDLDAVLLAELIIPIASLKMIILRLIYYKVDFLSMMINCRVPVDKQGADLRVSAELWPV